ncbi:hypothetical protein IF1G_05528 [Cordyceps javanica]|uniref:Uncharacterized protein n=1 Tax=Cordyceps javanica TaxID=43265 RepID=A0A545V1V7_9HYPO|nr:hypothetical protein IF1G_05528 [Cordyceps javanica]
MGLGTDTRSGPSGRQEGRAAGGRCTQLTVFISGILLSLVTKLPSTKVPTNTAFRSPQRCFSQSLYFVGSEQLHQPAFSLAVPSTAATTTTTTATITAHHPLYFPATMPPSSPPPTPSLSSLHPLIIQYPLVTSCPHVIPLHIAHYTSTYLHTYMHMYMPPHHLIYTRNHSARARPFFLQISAIPMRSTWSQFTPINNSIIITITIISSSRVTL